jgi:hypothetical protein
MKKRGKETPLYTTQRPIGDGSIGKHFRTVSLRYEWSASFGRLFTTSEQKARVSLNKKLVVPHSVF